MNNSTNEKYRVDCSSSEKYRIDRSSVDVVAMESPESFEKTKAELMVPDPETEKAIAVLNKTKTDDGPPRDSNEARRLV